jgi:hypothetical protein
MTTFRGQCHCGNIEILLTTALALDQLVLRACTCSFCRRHSARTTSDPNGQVEFIVHSDRELSRYRFGLKTADFLLCRKCGVYVGAVIAIDGRWCATLNVNIFDSELSLAREATPVNYEGETESVRVLRRQSHWTPARISLDNL